jgi:hypothetical protein
MRLGTPRTRTGMSVSGTCRKCTSSESATRPKSSSERITSDSISSTATRAPVESGPTCWRMPVCWKKTQLPGKSTQHSTGSAADGHQKDLQVRPPNDESMLKRWWVLVIQDKWRISRKRAGYKKGIAGAQRKDKDQWVRIHGASIGRSASKHWPRNRSAF